MKKKVTFVLSPETVAGAQEGLLLGEFNHWAPEKGYSLKKTKDGGLSVTVSLEAGRSYQYRYLLSDGRWVNDNNAIRYIYDDRVMVDNCLIAVPEEDEVVEVAKKPATKKAPAKKAAKPAAAGPDDLTLVEGIGKKIAEILAANGVRSFDELSKQKVTSLRGILDAAGSRYKVHDPGTWPKQAKLAATGKWEELKKLQAELKGGN
jgi:predicted flap endonuclease-1-like 5' DNA nuclease